MKYQVKIRVHEAGEIALGNYHKFADAKRFYDQIINVHEKKIVEVKGIGQIGKVLLHGKPY